MEPNKLQKETIEMLSSIVDNLQIAPESDGVFVFEGEGQDGPSVGYIEIDGKVSWITGG